jgi:hypothetical protein
MQWLYRRLGLITCKYGACADHLEVFCIVHQGETIDMKLTDEQARELRKAIHSAKPSGLRPGGL